MKTFKSTNLTRTFHERGSRRRQSALISGAKKLAPTDVGGYTSGPFSRGREVCRLTALALGAVLMQWAAPAVAQPHIEQVQRDFQIRYHAVTGGYLDWPKCSGGETPAPRFPKDGFYGDISQDPDKGVALVQDLVQQFYSDKIIYNRFVKANGFGDLDGVPSLPMYTSSDMEPIPSPAGVTSATYPAVLQAVANALAKLKFLSVHASQVIAGDYSDNKFTWFDVGWDDRESTCAGVVGCIAGHHLSTPWGFCADYVNNIEDDGNDCEFYSQFPLDYSLFCYGHQQAISCEIGSTLHLGQTGDHCPWAWAQNTRGKIKADLTNFKAGTAKILLKLNAPTPDEDLYRCGTSTFVPTFAQARPTTAPEGTYGTWPGACVPVGSVFTSDYIPESTYAPSAMGACDLNVVTVSGWKVADAVAIVQPDFSTIQDEQDCCACNQCEAGDTSSKLSSIHVSIALGGDNFGNSAGALALGADWPSLALATPSALRYSVASTVEVITNATAPLQHVQFKTSQALSDVLTNNNFQYTISFYTAADAGTKDPNGFYVPTGPAFKTIVVQNPDTSGSSSNRLRITVTADAAPTVTDYIFDITTGQWEMDTGNGLRKETRTSLWDVSNTFRTEGVGVTNADGSLAYMETNIYQLFPWGEERIQNVVYPAGAPLTNTWSFYSDPVNDGGNYRQLKQEVDANGHWVTYQYDQYGRETNRVTQFLNSPVGFAPSLNRVTSTTYSTNDPQITIVEWLQGVEVGRRYKLVRSGEVDDIQCQTRGAAWNASDNLVTVTKKYTNGSFAGQLQRVQNPDGTVQIYTYATNATQKTTTVLSGVPDPNDDSNILIGNQTVTVASLGGQILSRTASYRVSGSPDIISDQDTYTYLDSRMRSYVVAHLDGTTEQFNYGCCGLLSQTDRDGTVTQYAYDALKRQVATVRNGITTSNIFDANGAVLATIRIGADNSSMTLQGQAYDVAGRLVRETNALQGVTVHTNYFDANGQLVKKTTYPDTGTRIETYYQDGSLQSVGGTAVYPVRYEYGVGNDGTGNPNAYAKEIKLDAGYADTLEWTSTFTDIAGRAYETVYAGASGTPFAISYYNARGQLTNQIDPDGVSTLYVYNAKGEQTHRVLDLDQNHIIGYAGDDRVTFTTNDVVLDNGTNVRRTRTFVWSVNGLDSSTLVSTVETSADGLRTWTTIWNGGVPLTSQSQTFYDPAHGYRIVTNTAPDGSYAVATNQYGRLISMTQRDATGAQIGRTIYGYDPHGRQNTVTDARNGTTTSCFNSADQVSGVVSPAPATGQSPEVTTNYFDNMGRIGKTTLPDSTSVTNEYYLTGLLGRTYGSRRYPVGYGYDAQGRVKTMTNWTGFATSAGARVTTWNYHPYRGFLSSKVYDGNVAGPSYAYTAAGRLLTRLWARGITTTYGYNNAGDLQSVTYANDPQNTPGLTYGYDRRGRQTTNALGGTVVTTRAYDDAGDLLSESYSGGPLDGLSVTNGYDQYLRRTSLSLLSPVSRLLSSGYGYDSASRLRAVSDGNGNSATYNYLANSPLVSQISFTNGTARRMVTTKQYDFLNRLLSSSSSPSSSSSISFSYRYNSANQRTAVTNADTSYWRYLYDNLGQVISGKKFWSDNSPVAGQQFEYTFDDIGNRQTTASGGDNSGGSLRPAFYTANSLNQYTSLNFPGYVWMLGTANANATVTLWGSDGSYATTLRKGQYFDGELWLNNVGGAFYTTITNLAVLNNGSNPDIVTNIAGNVFVAKTPEPFGYDGDGNLTSDGRWTYTWDAENRLVTMQALSTIPAAAKLKLDFTYDWQGRRIQKTVSTWNGSAYVTQAPTRFAYDGWNLIATLSPQSSILQSFVWGVDLSGSPQGAGGVGGLLMVYDSANGVHFAGYDGNGNAAALVKAVDGTVSAQYEYGPFGEVLRVTGLMGKANPFRFSTRYQDDETDLRYYGYRYYNPSTGRWLSRDPIGERGELHLYAVCGNDIVNFFDILGLWDLKGVLAILCCNTDATGQNAVKIMARYTVYSIEPQTGKTQYYVDATKKKKVGEPVSWRVGGYHSRGQMEIAIDQTESNEQAAATVIHETTHARQYDRMDQNPNSHPMSRGEKEREAAVATEQWRLDRGFPPEDPSFRIKDPKTGKETLDVDAIYKKVDPLYGISSRGQDLYGEKFDVDPASPKKKLVGPWKCP